MSKRKEPPRPGKQFEEEESSSDEDTDMLDVDFEFFDPQPEVDFHGLKTLLRQLLDVDAQLLNLSALADLILSQPLLGSTVKVDGNETDPYAFLTILNLHVHKDKPVIQAATSYIKQQASKNPALGQIAELLTPSSSAQVGLVLTERLVNIPSEVAPPMYKMLQEEIEWAVEEKEPYTFSHYLVLSKNYTEVASLLDEEDNRPQKKKRKETSKKDSKDVFNFHPEDEVLHRHAIAFGDFSYVKEEADGQSDAKRTFQDLGIKPQGHLILIEASKFGDAIKAMEDFFRTS